jgi:hypothetical protein
MRENIGPDLEEASWVSELVDFVKNDDRLFAVLKKELGILNKILDNREIAIDISGPF